LGGQRHDSDLGFEWGDFSIAEADPKRPPTEGLHLAFSADSQELVDSWWRGMTEDGYRSDGAPGPRPQYRPDYYGAFILDVQGNSVEAVTHAGARERARGLIDHLWIRVGDLAASTRFYETVAPQTGFRPRHETGDRATFVGEDGSFTLVSGTPTEGLHMAFAAAQNATVEAFHRVATAAGYADNGIPGERPIYHAGYYGAFVLDPDGNNIEVVNHNR
jgi:catechol 2,3-dioxygenase-like lactoylglutathione lyase family enzyme